MNVNQEHETWNADLHELGKMYLWVGLKISLRKNCRWEMQLKKKPNPLILLDHLQSLPRFIFFFKTFPIASCMSAQLLSRVWLFGTPRAVAHQAPLSMEFSRQEHWGGFTFPSPGDLPDPATEPGSPVLAGGFCATGPPGTPLSRM